MAADDEHALELVRAIVANLNARNASALDLRRAEPPRYDPAELYGDHPDRRARTLRGARGDRPPRRRLAVRRVQAALWPTLVTGFARIWGYPVAILANNGVLFSESALKGAHFIELACQRGVPLVFLQNISGFMVGGKYEAGGIAKDGAKMVTAVACAEVPKFTVIIGGSFGAGNYGMCGRAYGPRFLSPGPTAGSASWAASRRPASWPPSAATAWRRGAKLAGRGGGGLQGADPRRATRWRAIPTYATARLWDDGIIDPAQTRDVLGLALAATLNAPIPRPGSAFSGCRPSRNCA